MNKAITTKARKRAGLGLVVGDRVKIERDEKRWPSRGTWPRYRGKTGTVSALNPEFGEVAVKLDGGSRSTWFLHFEVAAL